MLTDRSWRSKLEVRESGRIEKLKIESFEGHRLPCNVGLNLEVGTMFKVMPEAPTAFMFDALQWTILGYCQSLSHSLI